MSDLSERIEQVKLLMGARTQGEWDYESEDYQTASIFSNDQTPRGGDIIDAAKWCKIADGFGGKFGGTGVALPDVQFIVATANLMPLLIEDWEKQRAENTKLKGLLGRTDEIFTKWFAHETHIDHNKFEVFRKCVKLFHTKIQEALAAGTTETTEG
jgi:hypothetical protein